MKTLRVIGYVGLLGLQLSACSWTTRAPSDEMQKNGENLTTAQSPPAFESEKRNKNTTSEKPPQKVVVANLADGSHRLCTQPSTSKDSFGEDLYGWCFLFRKTGKRVVGIYT